MNQIDMSFMYRRDLKAVLRIERDSYPDPWTREQFCETLNQDCTGIVARIGDDIVGYIVYDIFAESVTVLHLTVDRRYRGRGIGSALLQSVVRRQPSRDVLLNIRETALEAQLFLKSQGFRCEAMARKFFEDTGEDVLIFRHGVESCEEADAPRRRS